MPTSVPQPRSDSEIEIIFDNENTGGSGGWKLDKCYVKRRDNPNCPNNEKSHAQKADLIQKILRC